MGMAIRKLPMDFESRYGYRPLLLESFVDTNHFTGTCYQAANWIKVGQTSGHAKTRGRFYYHGRKKDVYLYPLVPDFQKRLSTSGEGM